MKRRTKNIEVFPSEEILLSVLYLIIKIENDQLGSRELGDFTKLKLEEESKTVEQIP